MPRTLIKKSNAKRPQLLAALACARLAALSFMCNLLGHLWLFDSIHFQTWLYQKCLPRPGIDNIIVQCVGVGHFWLESVSNFLLESGNFFFLESAYLAQSRSWSRAFLADSGVGWSRSFLAGVGVAV